MNIKYAGILFCVFAMIAGADVSARSVDKCDCRREKAIAVNEAMSSTFDRFDSEPVQSVEDFVSYFAEGGFFQVVGLPASRTKEAVRAGFLTYTADPGEEDQHVVNRKYYWDEKTSTLTEGRTWFATLTRAKDFCGTILPVGATYSQ